MEKIYDMIIIGGGPGGYTAALYATRAGLSTLVLEKLSAGGQMALTSEIDNYPGFPQGVDGFDLGMAMQEGAQRFGAESKMASVTALELSGAVKTVATTDGAFRSRTVVLATGAGPRLLGLPKEQELTGKGLHYCAHCDGMFYRNKTVVVVGGGNSAVADALLLSRICKKVILVHRRDTLRATQLYHKQLEKAENVEFRWNSTISELLCGDRLTGVRLTDVRTGSETELSCDGLFVSIGRVPVSDLAVGQVALDENGYIVADESTRTSLPGVFAVGDVRTKTLRQIVTAVADGAVAAHYAEQALSEENV